MSAKCDFDEYFNGTRLIGDDYSESEILKWYEEEKDAYVGLLSSRENYSYEYHALNNICGFHIISNAKSKSSIRACGFGSAFGDELFPIKEKIISTVLIDSASSFQNMTLPAGVSTVLAQSNGAINVEANSFDLITCFGVLHHIPNVSYVMSEFYRCLAPGGVLMVREPTTSLGDWRAPRAGVTKNERGIPSEIFKEIILSTGFNILSYSPCMFPPLATIARKLGMKPYNSKLICNCDLLLSRFFRWNYSYHRTNFIDKFSPASDFYVCKK